MNSVMNDYKSSGMTYIFMIVMLQAQSVQAAQDERQAWDWSDDIDHGKLSSSFQVKLPSKVQVYTIEYKNKCKISRKMSKWILKEK